MQIVYNSPHYHVVEYPNGFELIDKFMGLGGYLRDEVAEAFRRSLANVIRRSPNVESVDDFLGNFEGLLRQPTIYH